MSLADSTTGLPIAHGIIKSNSLLPLHAGRCQVWFLLVKSFFLLIFLKTGSMIHCQQLEENAPINMCDPSPFSNSTSVHRLPVTQLQAPLG